MQPHHDPHAAQPHQRLPLRWHTVVVCVAGIALCTGLMGLGVWQVQRRAWKLDLIERVTQRLQAAPVPVPAAAAWPELRAKDWEYTPVQLQGHWLAAHTVLTQATTALGPGFWVLTPLAQSDASVVLVNRGFLPADQRKAWLQDAATQAAQATQATHASTGGLVTVQGLLRVTEPEGGFLRRNDPAAQRWYSRDVAAIAAAHHLPTTAPFFVDAGLPTAPVHGNPEATPRPTGPWPREGLTIVHFSNSHLVYALTWFALAAMTVAATVIGLRHAPR